MSVGSPRATRVVGISRVGGLRVHGGGGSPAGGGRKGGGEGRESFPGSRVGRARQRPGDFPLRKRHQPGGAKTPELFNSGYLDTTHLFTLQSKILKCEDFVKYQTQQTFDKGLV